MAQFLSGRMLQILTSVFEHLKNANVQILTTTSKRQINLFEIDGLPEIHFNGFKSPREYHKYLEAFYQQVQKVIHDLLSEGNMAVQDLLKLLDIAWFEVKTFRKQFFPKDQKQILFSRVEIHKGDFGNYKELEGLREKVLIFFAQQFQLLQLLEELLSHRIDHIQRFFCSPRQSFVPDVLPTPRAMESYEKGQLSLFPLGSPNTGVHWKRKNVEFAEVFTAIYESNAIKASNGSSLNKKDFFALMMWVFNLPIGHLDGTLNKGRTRKMEMGSPYLNELALKYKEMVSSRM